MPVGLYAQYGNYKHAIGEVSVKVACEGDFGPAMNERSVIHRITLEGILQAANISALTTALAALEAAYAIPNQAFAVYDSATGSKTAWAVSPSQAGVIGGVRVRMRPNYPGNTGAEYTTYVTYSVVVEWMTQGSGWGIITDWNETLTFSGGGPLWTLTPALGNFPPQYQLIYAQTPYRLTQEGQAQQPGSYPIPPPPAAPQFEHRHLRNVREIGPKLIGQSPNAGYIDYGVAWHYEMESAGPIIATPSVPY